MRKSQRPSLTRSRVVDAAMEVVDREGLDALSMRRLGLELGVEAMSLYNHIANKSALLDALHERILDEMAPPPRVGTWTAFARHQAKMLRAVLRRHPNAVTLFATRPAATPASRERLESYLAILRAAGLDELAAGDVIECVSSFVVGHTLQTIGGTAIERSFERGLEALLRGFT